MRIFALVQTVLEADSRHWQSGAIRSRLGEPGDIPLLPFLRVRVHNVEMDLGVLARSGATYMEFAAGGATCDDLRLAYSKIMTEYEVYNDDTFDEGAEVRCQAACSACPFGAAKNAAIAF